MSEFLCLIKVIVLTSTLNILWASFFKTSFLVLFYTLSNISLDIILLAIILFFVFRSLSLSFVYRNIYGLKPANSFIISPTQFPSLNYNFFSFVHLVKVSRFHNLNVLNNILNIFILSTLFLRHSYCKPPSPALVSFSPKMRDESNWNTGVSRLIYK